jgi:hypothetical protein
MSSVEGVDLGGDSTDPSPEEGRWPDPERGPYRLRLWFGRVEGRPAVVGVELWGIEPQHRDWLVDEAVEDASDMATGATVGRMASAPVPEAAAVRAEDVRLPLGRLLDAWLERQRASARASRKLWANGNGHDPRVERLERPERAPEAKTPGRPRLSDDFLRQVTKVYNDAVASGQRDPAVRVQSALGATTPETARSWIRQARQRGLPVLPPPKGRGAAESRS